MSKVKVGTSTVAGLLAAAAGFAAAVAAYRTGDRSEQTLGTIAGGTVGLLSLLSTQAGRFLQAAKAVPQVQVSRYDGFDDVQVEAPKDPEPEAPSWLEGPSMGDAKISAVADTGYTPEPDTVSCAAVKSIDEAVPNARHVVTRQEWKARNPRPTTPQGPPREAFLHHSDDVSGAPYDTLAKQESKVRAIQNFHMDGRGWSDIAYHYVVFQPTDSVGARAFAGRSVGATPAAQLNHNSETLAICVVGNGDKEPLDRNTRYVIEKLIERHPSVRRIGGHRDVVSTDCPGDHFYQAIPRIADAVNLPHF